MKNKPGDVVLSFEDCSTRAQARQKFAAWVDQHNAEQVRSVASQWLADDAEYDQAAFQVDLAELRYSLLPWRAEALAEFDRVADQVVRPSLGD